MTIFLNRAPGPIAMHHTDAICIIIKEETTRSKDGRRSAAPALYNKKLTTSPKNRTDHHNICREEHRIELVHYYNDSPLGSDTVYRKLDIFGLSDNSCYPLPHLQTSNAPITWGSTMCPPSRVHNFVDDFDNRSCTTSLCTLRNCIRIVYS